MSADSLSVNEIAPLAERIDREDWFSEELWNKMKLLGFMGLTIPEQYGGAGMDILTEGDCFRVEPYG